MFGFGRKKVENIMAPVNGRVVALPLVPDATFAERMLGDGIAVEPTEGRIMAPCAGTITMVSETGHAFAITSEGGLEILVHIGLDTVKMQGHGFKQLVRAGTKVKAGEPIIEMNLDMIKDAGHKTITPVVITNMDKVKKMKTTDFTDCFANRTVLMSVTLN
jgi:PTS system glucose-specific IIA component